MSSRYSATIVARIKGRFLAVNVSAEYTPGERGKTSGAPEDCYEGEPESFDGFRAVDDDGKQVELAPEDKRVAYDAIRGEYKSILEWERVF